MTVRSRLWRDAEWGFFWIFHSPIAYLWLIIVGLSVAAAVTLFTNPRQTLHLIEGAMGMAGLLRFIASVKRIPAWPRRRAATESDDAPHTVRQKDR